MSIFSDPFEQYPYVELSDDDYSKIKKVVESLESIRFQTDRALTSKAKSVGIAGEYAFAKYYGLDFDVCLGEDDGGYDYKVMEHPSGVIGTIDVKSTDYNGGNLIMEAEQEVRADTYFLVEKRGDAFGLIGYAKRSTVANAPIYGPEKNFRCPTRFIERDKLRNVPPRDAIEPA